ncbi:hypothetical protein BLOT_012649 [Blomia tropicalis]|nr:hypothetical protein BLOT_012649 [Blomia tropicalis]
MNTHDQNEQQEKEKARTLVEFNLEVKTVVQEPTTTTSLNSRSIRDHERMKTMNDHDGTLNQRAKRMYHQKTM